MTHQITIENAKHLPLSELFDALLLACARNDQHTLDILETTPLDFASGGDAPLLEALNNNHLECAVRIAKKTPLSVLAAVKFFLGDFNPNPPPSEYRAAIVQNIIPLAQIPFSRTPTDKGFFWFPQTLVHLTEDELPYLTPIYTQYAANVPLGALEQAVIWLSEYKIPHASQTMAWLLDNCSSVLDWQFVFEKIVDTFPHAAMLVQQRHSHVKITHNQLEKILLDNNIDELKNYAPVFKTVDLSEEKIVSIVKNFGHGKYKIRPTPLFSVHTISDIFGLISIFIHKLDSQNQSSAIAYLSTVACESGVAFLRSEFSDVWNNNKDTIHRKIVYAKDSSSDMLVLADPQASVVNKTAALIKHIKRFSSGINFFALEEGYYKTPDIVSACLQSQNPALVRKMLHSGGVPQTLRDVLHCAEWADNALLQHVLEYSSDTVWSEIENAPASGSEDYNCFWRILSCIPEEKIFASENLLRSEVMLYFLPVLIARNDLAGLAKFVPHMCWNEHTHASKFNPVVVAVNGSLEAMDLVLKHHDPQAENSEAFRYAVEKGNLPMAHKLAPLCNPTANNSQALREAVKSGEREMFDFVLPLSNPKENASQALVLAVQQRNRYMVESLIPLSNVPVARHKIENEEDDVAFLDSCLCLVQGKRISESLDECGHKKLPRKI